MCVIVIKPKGHDFPPVSVIEQCIDTNRHGNAMAWDENGELNVFRSLDRQQTIDKYKELTARLNPNETSLVFHARIATHGDVKLENCHGFLHQSGGKTYAFFHNGMMNNIDARDGMTDSETFFRDLFIPGLDAVSMDYALAITRSVGGGYNRYAIIDNEGHVWYHGGSSGYYKEAFPGCRGKIYFSNLNWKPKSVFGLGFNPYGGVSKTDKKGGSGLPSVGKRDGKKPVLVTHNDDCGNGTLFEQYEQRYAVLAGSGK